MVNVGIDLHKTQFTVCVRREGGEQFVQYPTTEEGYRRFLQTAAVWKGSGEEVRVGVESTGNTRYFKSRLEAAGIRVTVINTLRFKVVNESVNKTDKHDAATIVDFLEKDMLPESRLCSRESEQLRRLLKARATLVRAEVVIKNQIHALLTAEGLEDVKGSLQSKKGRQQVLDTLNQCVNGLVAQPLFETIEQVERNVNSIEKQIEALVAGDRVVELLMTIPGCGPINAWTIRAYTDEIKRFTSAKKYTAYAGLVPWVQNSNETFHYGKITKRGPRELRTAFVQVVMGMRRMKNKLAPWRLMQRHEALKKGKIPGVAIIATARKVATIIWHMLTEEVEFDVNKMVDEKLAKKSEEMGGLRLVQQAMIEGEEKPVVVMVENKDKNEKSVKKRVVIKDKKNSGVAGIKRSKVG